MKKQYTAIILSIFFLVQFISTQSLKAQSCWAPVGSGVKGFIQTMGTYNGNLIAAGIFDTAGGIALSNIAQWNGSSWSSLGSGIRSDSANTSNTAVLSLAVYNGELYAGGQFDSAGSVSVHNIAKWNGTSWSTVGSGIPGISYTVKTLAVYNGALYAGGVFNTAGGIPVHNIAKWNGTQWSDVDSGVTELNSGVVYCLGAYNNALYVAGTFNKAGSITVGNIAKWNDTIWSTLGSGLGNGNEQVTSMALYHGKLYAAVLGFTNHYTDSLAEWDGTAWSMIGGVISTNFNIGIDALFTFDSILVVGGGFDTIGEIATNNLAQWNGMAWSGFGGGVSGPYNVQVPALTIYNGYLYAGGYFTQAGITDAYTIAEYTCTTDDIHDIPASSKATVYPNPTTGKLNISTENVQPGSSVLVYDLLGKQIYKSNISSGVTEINLNDRAPGVYLYHISQGNGALISTGTIVIQ